MVENTFGPRLTHTNISNQARLWSKIARKLCYYIG